MSPVLVTAKIAKDKELVDRLLRAGLVLQVVRNQPTRWDR
jgi:hypothetical protein